MSSIRARRARGSTRAPWDLVPLALLVLCLGTALVQHGVIVAERVAAEAPWLFPTVFAVIGGAAAGGMTLWLRRKMRAGAVIERQRQTRLAQLHTLDGLRALTPTAFELAVAELLRDLAYSRVTHTGGCGDLCADLTCLTPRGQRVVVQCKRYGAKRLVGSPEIQQFLGMMAIHHRAERGLYVTTSGYTRHALALAACHAPAVELIDGEHLASLLRAVR